MRGTTPTLTFTTPYAAELVDHGYITFEQRDTLALDIPISDESVVVQDQKISVTLTQSQTLALNARLPCKAQIRLVLVSGKAVKSNIVNIPLTDVLKEGEI